MFKKFSFLIVFSFLITSQKSWSAPAGLAFLKISPSGRAVAMGEAFSSVSADFYSIYYNPSGLIDLKRMEANFTHIEFYQDVTSDYLGLVFPYRKNVLALNLSLGKVANIPKREGPTQLPLGTFDAHDFVVSLTWARKVTNKIGLGGSGKILYEKIDLATASGVALDIGGLFFLKNGFQVGASLLNLGSNLKFESEDFALPLTFRSGVSYFRPHLWLQGDWGFHLDLVKVKDENLATNFGVEYGYNQTFFGRMGYQIGSDEKNISLGFGFQVKNSAIDYAFVPYQSDLGNTHRFSLRLRL